MRVLNPWSDMPTPEEGKLSSKLLDSSSSNEFRWIKNSEKRIGLALLFEKRLNNRTDFPNFKNALIGIEPDGKTLTILLKNNELISQFRIFCEDCAYAVDELGDCDSHKKLTTIKNTILRWQSLFDNSFNSGLSKNAEIGLIGELLVLQKIAMKVLSPREAILSWNGPKGHEQDFSINGSLLEVKCQHSSKDKKISISSLDQLDTNSGQILLLQVGISASEIDTFDAFSLPSLVQSILDFIKHDQYATDTFLGILHLAGFKFTDEKDFDTYVMSYFKIYKLDDCFPKIVRQDIHPAIEKCTYTLNTSMLSEWEINNFELIEALK